MAAKTTVKVATLTGAAKDDAFSLSEGTGSFVLDVLANDPGAARLYSVSQTAGTSSTQFPVATSAQLSSGATISILGGQLVYSNPSAQFLPAGQVLEEIFTYTVRMANGALSTATVKFAITGENDAASISGANSGAIDEDVVQAIGGKLTVTDIDTGENRFKAVAAEALSGDYGDFSFDAQGNWTFALDNTAATVQSLGAGKTAAQQLHVVSLDGTAEETITVTITGVNDEARISGDTAGALSEDGSVLTTGGTLTVEDVDQGEEGFAPLADNALQGIYGSFTFDGNSGAWTYTLDNAAAQSLQGGQTEYDELLVSSLDGSASATVRVAISGADEPVVVPPGGDGGTGGGTGTGGTTNLTVGFKINQGQNIQNGRQIINGFDSNDTLNFNTNKFQFVSSAQGNYLNDNIQDTIVTFTYTQNANSTGTPHEVVLIGYTGPLTSANLLTQTSDN